MFALNIMRKTYCDYRTCLLGRLYVLLFPIPVIRICDRIIDIKAVPLAHYQSIQITTDYSSSITRTKYIHAFCQDCSFVGV